MLKLPKLLLALVATTLLSSTVSAQSDEWKFFPAFNDDTWEANFEVAAVANYYIFERNELNNGLAYGVEVSFDCPVFTPPIENPLRQQLSVNRYDKNGLLITSIEMNPYYFINLSDDLVLGFGPGLGAIEANPDNAKSQWLFSLQAGAGLKYYVDDFLIGADLRYQWTAEKDLGSGSKVGLDNTRFLLKAGYRF